MVVAAAAVLAFVLFRPERTGSVIPGTTPATTAPSRTAAPSSTARTSPTASSSSATGTTSSSAPPSSSSAASSAASTSDAGSGGDGGEGNGGSSTADVPTGYRLQQDPTGFAVAVPQGWSRSVRGTSTYYQEPNGRAVLQVDQTTKPKPDALADWQSQAAGAAATFPGSFRPAV